MKTGSRQRRGDRAARVRAALDAPLRARQEQRQLLRRDDLQIARRRRQKAGPRKRRTRRRSSAKWSRRSNSNDAGLVIKNGSGLFDANRVTTSSVGDCSARRTGQRHRLRVRRAALDRRRRRHAPQALPASTRTAPSARRPARSTTRSRSPATCSVRPERSPSRSRSSSTKCPATPRTRGDADKLVRAIIRQQWGGTSDP